MWKALEPVLTQSLLLLIPALATWLLAELRRRSQLRTVKRAVEQVEDENWEECEQSKKARAVQLVAHNTGAFTKMKPEQVGKMVERVLPKVQAANSQRPSSPDRRTVDVVFKE